VAHGPALGWRTGVIAGEPEGRATEAAGPTRDHAGLGTHPGTRFGQRHRHLDPQVDQLMELFLHLVQFLAALVEVPTHPLLVLLQGIVDFLSELPSLPAVTIVGRLPLRLTTPSTLLGQGRNHGHRRCQQQTGKQATSHVRTPSLKG